MRVSRRLVLRDVAAVVAVDRVPRPPDQLQVGGVGAGHAGRGGRVIMGDAAHPGAGLTWPGLIPDVAPVPQLALCLRLLLEVLNFLDTPLEGGPAVRHLGPAGGHDGMEPLWGNH